MFEYDGTEFTLEQVEEAALAKGLSVEEYTKKYEISKKTEAVVGNEIAPAMAETVDTESQSADGSSELQSEDIYKDVKSLDIEGVEYPIDQIKSMLGQKVGAERGSYFNGKNVYPDTLEEFISAYKGKAVPKLYENNEDEVVVTGERLNDKQLEETKVIIDGLEDEAEEMFVKNFEEKNTASAYTPLAGMGMGGPSTQTAEEPEDRIKFIDEATEELLSLIHI